MSISTLRPWVGSAWGARGPGPDRLGFGLGGPRALGRTGWVLAWGGQGSWAGPAWVWLGEARGPGPDRLGFGLGGQGSWAGPAWVWLWGPRVLGRAGLVLNTLKNHDSDGDVNIILGRTMTVMRMLI